MRQQDTSHQTTVAAPGKPPRAASSFGPHLDPTPAEIAGLVDDFSRLHSRDSAEVKDMPQPDGHHAHGPRGPAASAVHGAKFDDVKMEAEVSTDEWQSPSSDNDGPGDTLFSHGGSDMIDRIMKSFCASLDSKIVMIKETDTRPTIKTEQETAPRKGKVARSRKEKAGKILDSSLTRRSSAAPAEIQPLLGGPAPPARPSIVSAPTHPLAPPAPARAAAAPGAPAKPPARVPLGPVPRPPPLPPASATFRDRVSRFLSSPPPPPPPPPPQLLQKTGRDRDREERVRDRLSPPLVSNTPSTAASQPLGADTSPSRQRFSSNESDSVPRLRRRAGRGSVPHSLSVQAFAGGPGGGGEPAAASELQDTSTANTTHLREEAPTTGRWYRRFAKKRSGRRSGQPSSATASSEASPEDEEYEEEEAGSAVLLGQPSYEPPVFHEAAMDDTFAPPLSHFDLPNVRGSMLQSSVPSADLAATQDFFRPMQPEHFGHFQPYYAGDLDGRSSDHEGYLSALAAPEPPVAQPAPKMKRLTEPDEGQQDAGHDVQQEADGDGRRKKAKRGPSDAPPDSGSKKFACPYFKRNPKKYRKWTSCPGPGWDEVHRVKTHLYRRHPLPVQCPRCWEVFKADGQLQSHLQQDPPCAMQANRTLQEGFTKDQEKRLRSRKKTHADMTDEDKWREIYRILFPDDDPSAVPSPYYSEADSDGGRGGLNSGELEDYATFIRREMPTLVRRELETLFRDEFQDVEERLRPRIAEIVLNLQPRLLGLYKQSQMPLSEYGTQHGDAASSTEPILTPLTSQGTGTGPHSTPETAVGSDSLLSGSQLGFTDGVLDANWGAHYPDGPSQLQAPETDVGLGLDWDFEFDKLLNPMLFLPPAGEMHHEPFQVLTTQGA